MDDELQLLETPQYNLICQLAMIFLKIIKLIQVATPPTHRNSCCLYLSVMHWLYQRMICRVSKTGHELPPGSVLDDKNMTPHKTNQLNTIQRDCICTNTEMILDLKNNLVMTSPSKNLPF